MSSRRLRRAGSTTLAAGVLFIVASVGFAQSQVAPTYSSATGAKSAAGVAGQKAKNRFVFGHHPPMTAVASRQGDNPHMMGLELLFQKYKVTAGFFGHDHNYQHYLKNGIHYVITGGGGAPLYDVDKPPDGITLKVVSTEHFVTVSVEGKTARIEAIAVDGRKLDEIEFQAGGQR